MSHSFHDLLSLGGHAMPGSWVHLLPEEARWLRLPREQMAACGSCPPVALGDYVPECRCCGYLPQMTNFALGFALQGPSADAVRAVIDDGHALPFGLSPSPRLFAEAIGANAAGRFGQDPALACPFKDPDTHRCGVYPYRNSVCSTFFCHHDLGDRGEELWGLVQAVAGTAETAIAQWSMGEAGRAAVEVFAAMDGLAPQVAAMVQGERRWTEASRRAIWGPFFGREEDFFLACAAVVADHAHQLVAIASRWTLREPAVYQQALKDALPPESQEEFPQIDDAADRAGPVAPAVRIRRPPRRRRDPVRRSQRGAAPHPRRRCAPIPAPPGPGPDDLPEPG
jgi:Fe-S-cluster containining protein